MSQAKLVHISELDFVDDIIPTPEAIENGIMSFRVVGYNEVTGRYIAEATITQKGRDLFLRTFPIADRNTVGGVQ